MKKASNYAYVAKKSKQDLQSAPMMANYCMPRPQEVDLNVFVLTFDGTKEAQKNLAGGDSYDCKKCGAILNKYSVIQNEKEIIDKSHELNPNQSLWVCEFCNYPNILLIEK